MRDSNAHDSVANAETTLQQQIRLALGTRPDARIFRNQVGSLPDPRTGRLVTFGLARGSADLIGWRTITVTPDMVGTQLAIFTSIEVKTPTGRIRPGSAIGSDVSRMLCSVQACADLPMLWGSLRGTTSRAEAGGR